MLIHGQSFDRLQVGPIQIHAFGVFVVLGFLGGAWLSGRLARERGLPGSAFLDSAVAILLAGVAGARLLFVLLNWREFSRNWTDVLATWQGGMSFHGGVAGGALAGVICMRRMRLPVALMADAAAPGLALGYAVGRIGCLFNGCCYGTPTQLPWGMTFRDGLPGVHYHPTQLYAALANLLLMAMLLREFRMNRPPGQVMALFAAGYSVYRFGIEALRNGVTADLWAFGLTQAQAFSVLSLLVSLWIWWRLGRNRERPDAP